MVNFILSSAVVLLVASLSAVQGLDCYHCYDTDLVADQDAFDKLEGPWNPLHHVNWKGLKSCTKKGDLSNDLKRTCATVEGAKTVCATMTFNVNMKEETLELPPGVVFKPEFVLLARGCLHVNATVEPMEKSECTDEHTFKHFFEYALGPVQELIMDPPSNGGTTDEPTPAPSQDIELPDVDITLRVCPCTDNNCNPASAVSPGVLSLLATFLVLPFALR